MPVRPRLRNQLHGKKPAHRRVARQGQDDQQIPRQGLPGPGLLRPCARPGAQGRRGRSRTRLHHGLRGDRTQRETRRRDRQGGQAGRRHLSGDRLGSRRRGDLLAHQRDPEGARPAEGSRSCIAWCFPKSRRRRSRQPWRIRASFRTTWSMRSRRAARWITWSASIFRRCCGARCNAGLSAGRVQSPALRMIVEREEEIEAFKAARILDDRSAAERMRMAPSAPA